MKNTAVLIFANSTEAEGKNKSFSFGSNLFASLNERTIQVVQKSGISYFHISDKDQVGDNFGERFSNAIQVVFDKGFDNVISIGNDTPTFTQKHLQLAAENISNSNIVLGPSRDGGFYLLGINKANFNSEVFQSFSWQTSAVSRELISFFSQNKNIKIQKLQMLMDLDSFSDLKNFQEKINLLSASIKKAILNLLFSFFTINSYLFFHFLKVEKISVFNKGSPFFASKIN